MKGIMGKEGSGYYIDWRNVTRGRVREFWIMWERR
jgi:hypothetical protein